MSARRWLLVGLAAVALLLVAGRVGGALYVDRAWYAAMGAESLWRAKLVNTLLLRGVTALLGTAFVFANLYFVRHSIVSLVLPRRVGDLEFGEEVPGRTLMAGVLLLSAALGALLTIPYGDWTLLAQAWRGRLYGELDPFHQIDLGFWVHWLPLETALYHWALLVLLVVSIVVVALYALTPSLRWDRGSMRVTTYVRRHLVVLGSLALVMLGWSYRLDQYRLLVVGTGVEGLFTWADHHVRLTANAALSVLALVIAVIVLVTGWMGQTRRAFVGVTLVLLLSVGLRQALPAILERTQAAREYAAREGPYERTRAAYSRRAVGLEALVARDPAAAAADSAPRAAVAAMPSALGATADGASAWDARALAVALARGHRGAVAVGDLAWAAGPRGLEARAVMRPASEAASDPTTAWTLASVDAGTSLDGAPDAIERPLPPPLVWPGARGYAVREDAGGQVPSARLGGLLSRIAHAWGEQNPALLDGDLARPGVRLVLRRDVRERVQALAPFFAQDDVVTPLVGANGLHWAVHLYAASDWYPLAAPVLVRGYEWRSWRHAATAVLDAGTGRVRLVAAPERDALGESWIRMFPALFVPVDSLPPELAAQLPPLLAAAEAQAATFGRTGFGSRVDTAVVRRAIADGGGDSLVAREATPFVAGGGAGAAAAVAVPLLDAAGTLAGAVVARGGARPVARWLPAARGTPWEPARERLAAGGDTATAAREGRLVAGGLRAVPLADGGLALIQSQYRWRGDAPPTLVRVAALVADTVRDGRTLAAALGSAAGAPDAPVGAAPGSGPAGRAGALYDRMRDALRRGDWRAFGEAFDALGAELGRTPR